MHIGVTWGWGVLSPGCGQLMTVCVIIVIKLHDTNLSLSHRVKHTTTSMHQTTEPTWSQFIEKIFRISNSDISIILSQSAGGTEAIVRSL